MFLKKIRQIPPLNYIDYKKTEAKQILMREIGRKDYGGKYYESIWTRFFQGYYLPKKFGYDKRRAHLSTLIRSGQISRDEALHAMDEPVYPESLLNEDMHYILKKFDLTEKSF